MSRPVVAYHLIITCYGFWLPNDPRGSGSHHVWSEALRPFGPATYTGSRRSVAKRPHDWRIRAEAKSKLKHPPVLLNGTQARAVVRGFATALEAYDVDCYACAVMPDHAHLVVRRAKRSAESLMIDLKAASVHALLEEGIHPFQAFSKRGERVPKAWARSGRKIFLFDTSGIERSIHYVNQNPQFDGLPPQYWKFVEPFDSNV